MKIDLVGSSFRDPKGFVFKFNDEFYRQINVEAKADYDHLMKSGLYDRLIAENLLISHVEMEENFSANSEYYKIIKPEQINFISYPYEWSFSQIKDAALTTITIQKIAMEYGMSLKDASAYNIQFLQGRPVFIDTLSFELLPKDKPWVAYKQFCQHFLAPLSLMAYKDISLNKLLSIYIDGIPLDLASSLLPKRSTLNISLLFHIHFHSKSQQHFSDKKINVKQYKMTKTALLGIIDSLESSVKKIKLPKNFTEWDNYYDNTNYSEAAFEHKKEIINNFLEIVNPLKVWDVGGNTGVFSRVASNKGIETICFDIDPNAIEKNYLEVKVKNEKNILPLLCDLINPSPSIGWANKERMSLIDRQQNDTVIALALIHHLSISNNLPFDKVANFFSSISKNLIIEFVPKTDSQVQKLLSTRTDIFPNYKQEIFEEVFSKYFVIKKSEKVLYSERIVYLMSKK